MPTKLPVTLQLYTLRDDLAQDFAGTIAKVAEIGYAGVELAGFGGLSAADVKALLDQHKLVAAGSHVGIDAMEKDIDSVIEQHKTIGTEFVSVPWLAEERRKDIEGYKAFGRALTALGAKLKEAGLTLCYHNHAFEFEKFGGDTYGYDALFGEADPDLVKIEMDTYWVKKGGEDPAAYIRKYAGRVPLLHIKDMAADADGKFAEVGEGVMDFPAIFEAAGVGGAKFYIVEQDQCYNHPPLESVAISFRNLQKMGMA
jgi:sugar phosphate isomerase/epimerase